MQSRFGRLTIPALLILFPTASYADVGSLGGIAMVAFTLSAGLWVVLTLLFGLFVCRRFSIRKRLGATILFFFLPVLTLAAALLKEYAFGESTRTVSGITEKPVVVSGVIFPPGSQAEYDQKGGFFGLGADRTLQAIHSPHPVLLGTVPIDGLIFIPETCCDQVRAEVSEHTIVDGWPCGETTFDITPAGPALRSCFLAAAVNWRGKEYQAGSFVDVSAVGSAQ